MLKLAPTLLALVLIGPVLAGLVGVGLPAFGYLPALGATNFNLTAFEAVLATPGIVGSIAISFASGLITPLAALAIVALFFAAWNETGFFRVVRRAVSPLVALPYATAALAIAFLIAPAGWIVRAIAPLADWSEPPNLAVEHDPFGLAMMAALVVKEIAFLFLVTLLALPRSDARRLTAVATSLGYGRVRAWFGAAWPQLYRQIRVPVYAVIAYASSNVDVALILGPTNPPPLSVLVLTWINDPNVALRIQASAGAVLQLGVTAAAILVWRIGELGLAFINRRTLRSGERARSDRSFRGVAAIAMGVALAVMGLGLLNLAIWSVSGLWSFPDLLPIDYSLIGWTTQAPLLLWPVLNTIFIGLAATFVAMVVVIAVLERESDRSGRNLLPWSLLFLPLVVPQVTFLFGLQILLNEIGPSFVAVAAMHVVFVLPFVGLALADPWRRFDRRYAITAASVGAGRLRVLTRIRLPLMLRSVGIAAALGFAISAGQYLATLMLGGALYPTVTTEAVAVAESGNRRLVGILAMLQIALPLLAFLLAWAIPILRFRKNRALRAA